MPIRLTAAEDRIEPGALDVALEVLQAGGVVVYPTDTLYGLAADPQQDRAVARLFEVKGRGQDVAIPLIASTIEQVEASVGTLTPLGRRLAERFWPGPLTLVIAAASGIARAVHGGRHTVAVRVPAHAVARALATRHPITSTSANRSGRPPVSSAADLDPALAGQVDVVVDGGSTRGGAPSTIVDVTHDVPTLVRAGAVPWERVLESLKHDT
jgi:L-threonylcarbamoyladenylate synthase